MRSQGQDMTQQEWSSHSAGAVYFSADAVDESVVPAARARPANRVAAVAPSAAAPKPRRDNDGIDAAEDIAGTEGFAGRFMT
ncbi:hypothetical protein VR44_34110 [Streptomyces katrae]|uniref:Uncharacterized protein n=1 Tax=Streptomyces katrae TaxID=68223 RepID=A0A0F4IS67_9ACTN|nr:hypothetical protein VR44_34110 [Streptomyces katrae]